MRRKPPEALIEALAVAVAGGHNTLRAAAVELKIPERTAKRWAADPGFKARARELRLQLSDRAIGIKATASAKAAIVMVKLLDDPDPEIRYKTARAIFADLISMDEYFTLARELTEPGGPDDHS